MSQGVSVAFKVLVILLLLGILGVSIGVLIVDLNIRDDVEATPAVPSVPTTASVPTVPTVPTTTTKATPVNPDGKNIPNGPIIQNTDKRFAAFQQISDLYERWMNTTIDPCDDFYHYVCGKGQQTGEQSPFTISSIKNNDVVKKMWGVPDSYWKSAPLPVKQAKWIRDRCISDNTYTTTDQQAKLKEMMEDYITSTGVNVPFLYPNKATAVDKTALAKLVGYAKGRFEGLALLTSYVSVDLKNPDTDPYRFYIDEPLPIFPAGVYNTPAQAKAVNQYIVDEFKTYASILKVTVDDATLKTMAQNIADFDEVIATTMIQDSIVRRQTERNYNPHTLDDLNQKADQFEWVQLIQSAMTLLGDQIKAAGNWKVIIMEEDITLNKLNALLKKTDAATIANYVFFKTFSKIQGAVPPPPSLKAKEHPLAKLRATVTHDRRTVTGMLRKPDVPETRNSASGCQTQIENLLPWAATRMYVDSDIPNNADRQSLKSKVEEYAKWIFFGFRSQLDQLNWMDDKSKQGAFDKLNNIQLNIAFPDWVADDAELTDYYKGLDINENDNYMNQWIKLTNYRHLNEFLPLIDQPDRDRGDFGSFIGITNAWYQPQANSITFPEGILQEPFYNPNYPLATIFGGLGSISGHELTHGFDDQGVQWDGIGALNAWMTDSSQTSFNAMAQCVIDEYSGFCPYDGVCLNGANTQGENIADNGGIQAAYKALKAYESLNGADPRLPGFGADFTSDQLFFLTFGQTWCDQDLSKAGYEIEILTDVHSPAYYRVLGTIQNFPAFRNAFNCPVGTDYTPEKHCDVWTSRPF